MPAAIGGAGGLTRQEAKGLSALRSFGSAFPDVSFCPAGDITTTTAPQYLALPNVVCVEGSWMALQAMLQASDSSAIEALARGLPG